MRALVISLILGFSCQSFAGAGIEYEVSKTLQALSRAESIDRALKLAMVYYQQEGPSFVSRSYDISTTQDPVASISMGFLTTDDINNGANCQTNNQGSCLFTQELLGDTQAQAGNLAVEVNFKETGVTPSSLRAKKVVFYAMGLGVDNKRIVKESSTQLSDGSIASFTCKNPATDINRNIPAGTIGLQDNATTNQTINILVRANNALHLCSTNE